MAVLEFVPVRMAVALAVELQDEPNVCKHCPSLEGGGLRWPDDVLLSVMH